MQRVGMRTVGVTASVVALLALAACTGSKSGPGGPVSVPHSVGTDTTASGQPSTAPSSSSTPPAAPAKITIPRGHGTHINPRDPVQVDIAGGTLTSVKMTNPEGEQVKGKVSSDGTSWQNTEVLGYGRTYKIVAKGRNGDGVSTKRHTKITTLTPSNMTLPYFNTIYGSSIENNATYGVGMVVAVHFDESIPDKQAAEKAMTVTTSPHVDGAWYWTDDATAHWRPRHYYQPGTQVSVHANVYGRDLGSGLYGQSDESIAFKIGAKHYSVANAKTHHVKVFFNDKLKRTMPTSMGQGGWVDGKYGKIALWTPNGIYTVINHENPAIMSSDSYGLPASSPYGYKAEKVYWSTKISTDGIYLHELDTTVWAQGNTNVSHGCLNLNYTNAHWFYQHSRVGDVVKVVKSGGPPLTVGQGGDWSVPWKTWVKGGAAA